MKASSFFHFPSHSPDFSFSLVLGSKWKLSSSSRIWSSMSVGLSLYFTAASMASLRFYKHIIAKCEIFSTVTKFWRIIYETLKRAFLQLFPGPEHLNNISPVCCRHIVERQIVLAGKSEALGCHLWWKFCKSIKKCHWRRTSMFSSILLAASNVGIAGRYCRSSVYQVVRFLYVTWKKQVLQFWMNNSKVGSQMP